MEEQKDIFRGNDFAYTVWKDKYALKDENGNLIETNPDDTIRRVAKEFYKYESKYKDYEGDKNLSEDEIYEMMKDFKYVIPGGSVLSGSGSKMPISLSNCCVLNSPIDTYDSIMETRNRQVQLMKRRGGVGFDISNLRPRGAKVNNAAVVSTGAASFMEGFSNITNEVAQGGRRGALMLTISINHPDSLEFIEKKQDLTKVTGANISVKITDEFMMAVRDEKDFLLRFPIDLPLNDIDVVSLEYDVLTEVGKKQYVKKVHAKELWDKIVHCAWNTAEPGIIFDDKMHNYAPDGCYPDFRMISTNPCITGDALIKTNRGNISLEELVKIVNNNETVEVLTYNEDTHETEYKEVECGMLTKENANIIEIETEDGYKVKLTPEHKVFTENRGWVNACDLNNHDLLVTEEKLTVIKQINSSNNEDVYDIKVKDKHNFFANGILVHNCGEIGMSGGDSCRLIAVNLNSFVDNPYTENASFDYDKLYKVSYNAQKLGDDLVDMEIDAVGRILDSIDDKDGTEAKVWKRAIEVGSRGRRTGTGFLGLGDALAKLGLKFDSDEGISTIRNIVRTMFEAELDSTISMAETRGHFSRFDSDLERKSVENGENDFFKFIKEEYPDKWEKMQKFGRRNISWSTVAPTGTISNLALTTSGIEPLFFPYYERKKKCMKETDRVDFVDKVGEKFTKYVMVHQGLKDWAYIHEGIKYEDMENFTIEDWKPLFEKSPYYGSTAGELDYIKRCNIQSIIQLYVSHSISSTENLPSDVTESKVSEIYFTAWENGCKGITIYRDGCRDNVISELGKKKETEKFFSSDIRAPKRPKSLEADFYTTRVKGEVFYVMVGLYENRPYEIFVYNASKSSNSAIVENHKGIITKVSKNKYNFYSDFIKIDNIASDLTMEELSTALYSSMLLRHGAGLKYIIKTARKVDDNITSFTSAMTRILSKYLPKETLDEVCPECGGKLVREGGCIHCVDCSWSRCS